MGWHLNQAAEPVALSGPVEGESEVPLISDVVGDFGPYGPVGLACTMGRGLRVGYWEAIRSDDRQLLTNLSEVGTVHMELE